MARFALSPAAYADIEDIDDYTLATWGADQRDRYIHALFDRFESREESEFANRILSAMRKEFGGHAEKS